MWEKMYICQKEKIISVVTLFFMSLNSSFAQEQVNLMPIKSYGNTLNIGAGGEYYTYLGKKIPFLYLDYQFELARGFTIAPYVAYTSYQGNPVSSSGTIYNYNATFIPAGFKGTYYLDRIIRLPHKWSLYTALAGGYVFDHITWTNSYTGDKIIPNPKINASSIIPKDLYWSGHIGGEYHITKRIGLFADISTNFSTVGISLHL